MTFTSVDPPGGGSALGVTQVGALKRAPYSRTEGSTKSMSEPSRRHLLVSGDTLVARSVAQSAKLVWSRRTEQCLVASCAVSIPMEDRLSPLFRIVGADGEIRTPGPLFTKQNRSSATRSSSGVRS